MSIVVRVVSTLFQLYEVLILIRVLLSWIPISPSRPALNHPLIQLLYRITDPILEPLRRIIPPIGGAIDISPMAALIILEIVQRVLVTLLLRL